MPRWNADRARRPRDTPLRPTQPALRSEVLMATRRMHPETAVLTRGFDPRLSVGAARPPVYRTSPYVFSSPEAAERPFAVALGKVQPSGIEPAHLIYPPLAHPHPPTVH